MSDGSIGEAAALLADARRVVVFTGSGVSAESGVPTFRDAMTGLWEKYEPQALATPQAFDADPELVSRWYDERRCAAMVCEPNDAHVAITELQRTIEERAGRCTLVTQNVDGLHERAGASGVIELHGSLFRWRGRRSGRVLEPDEIPMPFESYPPRDESGDLLRPGVVWFGESLPREAFEAADEASSSCDVFLSIGTSAVVYPAAGLIELASSCGASVIEVNPNETPATPLARVSLRGRAGAVVPEIVRLAFASGD